MRTLRSRALVVVGLAIAIVGCVREDPLVVGKRDASVEASAPPPLVEPQPDDPEVDAPDCRHCNETLNTDTARGALCRKNGPPSSARRLNALVDCVCYDKCVQQCGTYCAGSRQTSACSACILLECSQELDACMADKKE